MSSRISCIALTIAAVPATAWAEEPTTLAPVIVTTATRTESNIATTPAPIQLIGADDIQAMGATTLRDILEAAPGAYVSPSGTNLQVYGLGHADTVYLLNGRRIKGEFSTSYPEKLVFNLWSLETMRHFGVMEVQILALMGARPVWNEAGMLNQNVAEMIRDRLRKLPSFISDVAADTLTDDRLLKIVDLLPESMRGKMPDSLIANLRDADNPAMEPTARWNSRGASSIRNG